MNLLQVPKNYKDLSVLYVENDAQTRSQTLKLLKELFQEVVVFDNAEDAFSSYKTRFLQTNNYFDIIISAINLPKLNGIQLSEKIKQLNKQQVIAIYTQNAASKYLQQALNIGVNKFLIKGQNQLDDLQLEFIELAKNTLLINELNNAEFFLNQQNKIIDENVFITVSDLNGKIIDISQAYLDFTGYTREDIIGANHSIFKNKEFDKETIENLWHTLKEKKRWQGNLRNTKNTGEEYWVNAVITPLYNTHNDVIGYTSIKKDITNQKILEEISSKDPLTSLSNKQSFDDYLKREFKHAVWKEKSFALLLLKIKNYEEYENKYDTLKVESIVLDITFALQKQLNPNNCELFRISLSEFAIVVVDESDEYLNSIAEEILKIPVPQGLALCIGGINLCTRKFQITHSDLYCIANENLHVAQKNGTTCMVLDKNEENVKKLVNLDRLTKLPNRAALINDISSLKEESMLILLHMNQLNTLKDLYGESIIQDIIKRKAKELQEIISDSQVTLYSLNYQEFAFLVTEKNLFDKYFLLLKHSILLPSAPQDNDDIYITTSLTAGLAYGRQNIFNHANISLQAAILSRSKYQIYENKQSKKLEKTQKLERLKVYQTALYNGDIIPYFQPIIDTNSYKIVKYEALARIKTEKGEIVSPYFFLDSAKEDKTFEYFTRQMMQKVFNIYAKNKINISINLTYENISSQSMLSYIKNRLDKYGGKRITFEILESEDIDDYTVVENFVMMVKEYDCKIAIDDFGSGYSNFTNILRLNMDYIKLDGSLITQLNKDENINNMVHGIIQYAKQANIKTVAEFVSTKELSDTVMEYGVDLIQGYYYGKPQAPEYYGLSI